MPPEIPEPAPETAPKPKPPAETKSPPEWAKEFGLSPPSAAGVRATGNWRLDDQVTRARYDAALKKWKGSTSHG